MIRMFVIASESTGKPVSDLVETTTFSCFLK